MKHFIDRIIEEEGGYVNDPKDPGGETQYGISKRAFPGVDIENLTKEKAAKIYQTYYWDKNDIGSRPLPLQFQLLDAYVQHGTLATNILLQRALGVKQDGIIGPITEQAIADIPEETLTLGFIAVRIRFYSNIPHFNSFGRGWVRRMANNIEYLAEDL